MKEKLLQIVEHFGIIPQLKYFQSEVFELNEAIITYENDDYYYDEETEIERKEHITEELADVMVMLEQFKFYYGIEDMNVKEIMNKKIDRTIKRIKEGYYETNGKR